MTIRTTPELRAALWVIKRVKDLAEPMCAGDKRLAYYLADSVRSEIKQKARRGLQLEMWV